MQRIKRLKPNVVVRRFTSSHSPRGGAHPSLIVLHTTEGVMKLSDRARWWDTVPASSHVGVSNGRSARYVRDANKAWTCAYYNPVSLNIEIEGFASWLHWRRDRPDDIREVARWIAHWHIHRGIPIRRGITLNGRVVRSGVVTHKSLGYLGGGHSDPGNFPVRRARRLARQIAKSRKKGK